MEWTNPHTVGGESMSTKGAMSLFQGVTPRTAGFQTVSYPEMREPTLVVQTVLMFIGAAPTSTGGGIKVTTLALVVLIVVAQVRGQDHAFLAHAAPALDLACTLHSGDGLLARPPEYPGAHGLRRAGALARPIRSNLGIRDCGTLTRRHAAPELVRQDPDLRCHVPRKGWPDNLYRGPRSKATHPTIQIPRGGDSHRLNQSSDQPFSLRGRESWLIGGEAWRRAKNQAGRDGGRRSLLSLLAGGVWCTQRGRPLTRRSPRPRPRARGASSRRRRGSHPSPYTS